MTHDYGHRTPHADSLALQTLSYRCMGATGMDEDAPLDTIPVSLLRDNEEREPRGFNFSVEENQRLDSPQRGQAKWLNRR